MPTAVRTLLAAVLLGAATLTTVATAAAADDPGNPHPYSIPVGEITDLGDLTKIANIGGDLATLLGH